MSKIKTVSENKNYTAVSIGNLEELMSHSLIHPKLGTKIEGKVFLKDTTKATGGKTNAC